MMETVQLTNGADHAVCDKRRWPIRIAGGQASHSKPLALLG